KYSKREHDYGSMVDFWAWFSPDHYSGGDDVSGNESVVSVTEYLLDYCQRRYIYCIYRFAGGFAVKFCDEFQQFCATLYPQCRFVTVDSVYSRKGWICVYRWSSVCGDYSCDCYCHDLYDVELVVGVHRR